MCQSQSLNVFFPAGVDKEYLHNVHYNAWKEGNKSLYYLRTETSNKTEILSEKIKQNTMKDYDGEDQETCTSCQG